MRQVNTDLMSASCFQSAADQYITVLSCKYIKMCTGIFPVRTDAVTSGYMPVSADRFITCKVIRYSSCVKADCLIMPCNTAHCYHSQLQKTVHIPLLNMLELTCQAMADSGIRLAGLLATNGTVQTGVYAQMAERFGITLLTPDPEGQAAVMELIYQGVKAGAETFDTEKVCRAVDALRRCGAETIVLGCTELPLAVELYHLTFPSVDPTLELAKGAIRFVGGAAR